MADIVINEGSVVNTNTAALADATDMDICVPEIAEAYDEQLLPKKRACKLRENTKSQLQMVMRDKNGNGLDLTAYSIGGGSGSSSSSSAAGGSVQIRFREATLISTTTYAVTADVVSAGTGVVCCMIPDQVMDEPGVWTAEAGALNASDELLFTDEVYLYIEHSSWTESPSSVYRGPPNVDDVRLAMRDNAPYENELIENYDFTVAEICHAAIRTVHFWNDSPPPITNAKFSTHSFPYREIWLRGIKLFLFQMAEEHYRRNFFRHSSGGVTSDDKNRHKEYNQAWREEFAGFRKMVMHQKAALNTMNAYRGFGSGYGWR